MTLSIRRNADSLFVRRQQRTRAILTRFGQAFAPTSRESSDLAKSPFAGQCHRDGQCHGDGWVSQDFR